MKHLIGKTIEFLVGIEDFECYPEKNMRARIISISERDTKSKDLYDHLYTITFDYSEFDDYNKAFESSNYWDKNGDASLTAREAGIYEVKEKIHFGAPELWPFEDYFKLLDPAVEELVNRFKQSNSSNYIEWLESFRL